MARDSAVPHKGKRKRTLLEDVSVSSEVPADNTLVRALGSVDWHTRETGLLAISALLNHNLFLSEQDLLKIWKGIYVAYWHSDKPDVQVCGAKVV